MDGGRETLLQVFQAERFVSELLRPEKLVPVKLIFINNLLRFYSTLNHPKKQ